MENANASISQLAGTEALPLTERELTPLERAQDKMYEAWGVRSRKARLRLAREALDISPDCADAYVLLAEETARTPDEALKLYEEGGARWRAYARPRGVRGGRGELLGHTEEAPLHMRTRRYRRVTVGDGGGGARRRTRSSCEGSWAIELTRHRARLLPGQNN